MQVRFVENWKHGTDAQWSLIWWCMCSASKNQSFISVWRMSMHRIRMDSIRVSELTLWICVSWLVSCETVHNFHSWHSLVWCFAIVFLTPAFLISFEILRIFGTHVSIKFNLIFADARSHTHTNWRRFCVCIWRLAANDRWMEFIYLYSPLSSQPHTRCAGVRALQ